MQHTTPRPESLDRVLKKRIQLAESYYGNGTHAHLQKVLGEYKVHKLVMLGEACWNELQDAFDEYDKYSGNGFDGLNVREETKEEFFQLLEAQTSAGKKMLSNKDSWGWILIVAMCGREESLYT